MIDSDSDAWDDLSSSLPGGWKCCHPKGFIVEDRLVSALPIPLDGAFICLARCHAQRRMPDGFIFLVSPLLHSFGQPWERPHCKATGISRSGHLSRNARCLRIAKQMIEDGGVQGAEESFLRRPKPWFRRWALLFAYPIERKQLLQVDALKFRATIDHQSGRQTPIQIG